MSTSSIKLSSLFAALTALLFVFLNLSFQAPAGEGKLEVSGKVKNFKGQPLDSIMIVITDSAGKTPLDTVFANNKGKFNFQLEYNRYYRTYYVKEHFAKMFNTFNTKVPKSELYKTNYYAANITLLEDTANINRRAAVRKPFAEVYFDRSLDMFVENADNVMAFLEEVIKPNVGDMVIAGVFKDTLSDTFNVKVTAKDTLGFLLAETESEDDGSYSLTVPLQNKVELRFESENHYSAFAIVNSTVPDEASQNDFNVKQDFVLVNKSDTTVNPDAFNKPIARIEHLEENGTFVENPMVAEVFNDQLLIEQRRIALSGTLKDDEGNSINEAVVQVKVGDKVLQEVKSYNSQFEVLLPYEEIVHVHFRANEYHESFLSFNTNVDPENMSKAREMTTDVELISRENTEVNPMAFQYPMAKYYYSEKEGGFAKDSSISQEFIAALNTPVEKPDTAVSMGLVALNGQVFDPGNKGKSVPDARVRVLDENKQLVSAITTDKKGNYRLKLGLNRVYYLETEKDGFLPTQIKVVTQVPEGEENKDLPEQEDIDLLMIHPDNEFEGGKKLNEEFMTNREVTAFYYNPEKKAFTEDEKVFAKFEEDVRNYTPPSDEVPAVTAAMLAEAERKKKEEEERLAALEAEKNKKQVPELRLAGKVVDERNLPLEGVTVALYEGRKKQEKVETDSLGNYNIAAPAQKDMQLLFEGKDLHPVTANVNTTYPDSLEPKSGIITIPTLKTYTTSNVGINSKAFLMKWQQIAYDPESNSFKRDEDSESQFMAALQETPDNQYLWVEGKAKDQDGRNIGEAKILLRNNGQVVDSTFSDKRGRYRIRMDYQKDYRIEVVKQGYHSTFAAVSTNTNNGKQRLLDKKVKSFNLLLVNKEEQNINNSVFYRPYARVAYDSASDEFVEVESVNENFLADLYIEQEETKKEFNVKTTAVASSYKVAEKQSKDEYFAPVGASTENARKRSQNKGQAQKSQYMGSLHDIISGLDGGPKTRIQDVSLSLEQIYDARRAVNPQQQKEINEGLAEAAEQREIMSNLIAQALGMRRDADLVSTDSTFNVNLVPRIRHFTGGSKVYEIIRDKVFVEGKVIEYVETVDWFVWSTYYRNNKRISGKTYRAELDSIQNIAFKIN